MICDRQYSNGIVAQAYVDHTLTLLHTPCSLETTPSSGFSVQVVERKMHNRVKTETKSHVVCPQSVLFICKLMINLIRQWSKASNNVNYRGM